MKQTETKNSSCWGRRSALERGLIILVLIAVIISITLAVILGFGLVGRKKSDSGNTSDKKKVCLTPECIHTASRIFEYIDPRVEPCDDFYKFACGKFNEATIIADDEVLVSEFSLINKELENQLKIIIEEKLQPNDLKYIKSMKFFYQNCMNQTAIEERGLEPFLGTLKKAGGWPVLEKSLWKEANPFLELMGKYRNEGFNFDGLFSSGISIDIKNSTKHVLGIDQTSFSLSRDYLIQGFNNSKVKAYYDYMVDLAVIFGANRATAESELRASLELEIQLANITLPDEKRRNSSALYNPMTIKTLQTNYPNIPWKNYFNTLLSPIKIEDDQIVIVAAPDFFKEMNTILKTVQNRVLVNYIMWRNVAKRIGLLNDNVRSRQLKYISDITGIKERNPRWKECVQLTSAFLAVSTSALYIRKNFNKDSKTKANEIATDIHNEFIKTLENVNWLDEETRKKALEKAKSIKSYIGYPDELLDDKKIEEYYDKLEITSGDIMQSLMNITFFNRDIELNSFREPFNKTDWLSLVMPAIVNAFYSLNMNNIQIPAGILRGNFFNQNRPRYINYGAVGLVIGHEITHGFDDMGSQYDKEGNLVEWWSPTIKKEYLSRAECIIHQYGNYTVKEVGMNLNGRNTQGENIADNGGTKVAYLAYQDWVKRNGPEDELPGLNYTSSQLFWISTAQIWCEKIRPESLKLSILNDNHSPKEFRVLGSLTNIPEFAKDFKCSAESRMNPVKKCSVW